MNRRTRFHSYVGKRMQGLLEEGAAPWQRQMRAESMPFNPLTGRSYRSLNQLLLLSSDFIDPRWIPRAQVGSLGGSVLDSEPSTHIAHWQFMQSKASEEGQVKLYAVSLVNAEQMSGLGQYEASSLGVLDLEDVLRDIGADEIEMQRDAGLMLDDLVRWTGAPERLSRQEPAPLLSEADVSEALVVALASMQLGAMFGFAQHLAPGVVLKDDWIELVKNNPEDLFFACRQADDSVRYLLQNSELLRSRFLETRMGYKTRLSPRGESMRYLNVPFTEKAEAQKRGAKWSPRKKSWYVPPGVSAQTFKRWWPNGRGVPTRVYLAVSYEERKQASAVGATLDAERKVWYMDVYSQQDRVSVQKWLPKMQEVSLGESSCEREFIEFMRSHGVDLGEMDVVRDGRSARVKVPGDINRKKSGAYRFFTDGVPSAIFTNFRTDETHLWSATLERMSKVEWMNHQALSAQSEYDRSEKRLDEQYEVAKNAQEVWSRLPVLSSPTPYMIDREVAPVDGLRMGENGDLVVPLGDVKGKIWGLQTISSDGTKKFMGGCRLSGVFFVAGGSVTELQDSNVIIVAEGVSTALSIHQATHRTVIAAMQASNLESVARELKAFHPKASIVIAADNDRHLEYLMPSRRNIGLERAQEAANAVGGSVCIPTFDPFDWPSHVALPVPGGPLSGDQRRVIEKLRKSKDFNDLLRAKGSESVDTAFSRVISGLSVEAKREAKAMYRRRGQGMVR